MKFLKKLFYGLMIFIMALCGMILLCALNSDLTKAVSEKLFGPEDSEALQIPASNGSAPGGEIGGQVNFLPEGMVLLTGYEPIVPSELLLNDTDAQAAAEELSPGNTGEEYTFDPLFYPYYQMLTEREMEIYRQLYANSLALLGAFSPATPHLTTTELFRAFTALTCDHPELYFMETGYTAKHTGAGEVIEIDLSYYSIASNMAATKNLFDGAVEEYLGKIGKGDRLEKEKQVHDLLADRITYDKDAPMNQSAYSALVQGRTVCAGYARAFQLLMQELGIPCYYCMGYSGEDHAWDIIALEDGYANVDLTWDDTDPLTYDYYNASDIEFSTTHVRKDLSIYLPACLKNQDGSQVAEGPMGHLLAPMTYAKDGKEAYEHRKEMPVTLEDEEEVSDAVPLPEVLETLGISEAQILGDLDSYYADCKEQLYVCGPGQVQFINIVPATMMNQLEQVYGTGAYQDAYVKDALEHFGLSHFNMNLQVIHLGDGYYKLYHNIVTY